MAGLSKTFLHVPPELLIYIYKNTGNPFFPLTCKDIYHLLNNEHARFHFCSNIWDPTFDWGLEHPDLSVAQSNVVAHSWFTPKFALRVEEECSKRVEGCQRAVPRAYTGAKLPAHCLRPPWTDEKMALLERLTKWGVRAHWSREKRRYPGLTKAIVEGRQNVVEAYVGPAVNCAVEETDILTAIDTYVSQAVIESKVIIESLILGCFGFGPVKDMRSTVTFEAVTEKWEIATTAQTFNDQNEGERLDVLKVLGRKGDAGPIRSWADYSERIGASAEDFVQAMNSGMADRENVDDGPCPPGPWLHFLDLLHSIRCGRTYGSDYSDTEYTMETSGSDDLRETDSEDSEGKDDDDD